MENLKNKILQYKNEIDLYDSIFSLFRTKHCGFFEVPYCRKRVDVIFTSRTVKTIYAVELKIRNWRKAFKQAATNQLFAQYSYVALPEKQVLNLANEEIGYFRSYNIGLISVNHKATIIVEAGRDKCFNLNENKKVKVALLDAIKNNNRYKMEELKNAITKRYKTIGFIQIRPCERENSI